ncbi:MerR family transcriptional regulator [Actinokineospora pegani]|uniref:MerR family transcriptional regulator n=1 Tax=Actinokineospora pegani TaxID=2654637 RepID=UPI0012E9D2F2|nr:MerR family transcriptional regulator [Actinokineospora pegani]
MSWTVGEVARLSGVTVRALHHYDRIGLVRPGARTPAGYRRYGRVDLDRLQAVLLYRQLGFPLERIASLLDDPAVDREGRLREQRALLVERADRLGAMVAAVDRELEAEKMGVNLNPEERFEVFGEWRPEPGYAERAEQRWGDTPQWQESKERTAGWSKEDWLAGRADSDVWVGELRAAVESGVAPASAQGAAVARGHRELLGRFFECTPAMQVLITEQYLRDAEQFAFAVRPDQQVPGMVEFLHAAAQAAAG